MKKNILYLTSFYRGERYLSRFLCNARSLASYFKKHSDIDPVFGIALNDVKPATVKKIRKKLRGVSSRIIESERETVYASWNRLLHTGSAVDAVAVWNIDDVRFRKGSLAQARKLVSENTPLVMQHRHHHMKAGWWPLYFRYYLARANLETPTPFMAFNWEAYEKVGCFNEAFRISGDKEWYYRAQEREVEVHFSNLSTGILYNVGKGLSTSGGHERFCENLVLQQMCKRAPQFISEYYGQIRTQSEEER